VVSGHTYCSSPEPNVGDNSTIFDANPATILKVQMTRGLMGEW